jgi:peroxiredoxin
MKSRWIAAAAAACALALLVVPMMLRTGGNTAPLSSSDAGATCGKQGPANLGLTVKDMNGAAVRFADYKGKVIVLNFWATWCGPCEKEIPDLVETYTEYKDRGLVVLGVSIDDTAETLRAYAPKKRMNYPVLMMQDDVDEAYGPIVGVPITYVIDRNGSICRKHFGPVTKEQVEHEIKALL